MKIFLSLFSCSVFKNNIRFGTCKLNIYLANEGQDCKSDLPPLTSPLVQIADMERVVIMVTAEDNRMMTVVKPIPACPVIQVRRKNNITPKMFSKHRT